MQLDIRHHSARDIYALWGPVMIRIIDGARTEPADIDRNLALLTELLATRPYCGMLVVSHHGSPTPSLATLRYASNLIADVKDRTVLTLALLGLGFWAETSRATAAALMRLIGSPIALEGSVEAAARRMALDLIGIDPEALCAASEQLERAFRRTEAGPREV